MSEELRKDPTETAVYWHTNKRIPIKGSSLHGADYTAPHPHQSTKAKALDKDLTLHDSDGLFLLVKTTGKKIWRFRYHLPNSNKHTMINLVANPALSLADAREVRTEKLAMLVRGIDPQASADEEAEKLRIAQESIFVNVARKWFELKKVTSAQITRKISGIPSKRISYPVSKMFLFKS